MKTPEWADPMAGLKIEVVKFYPFELPGRKSGIVGYADVKIGGVLLIKAVRLMRNRHGGYYVQMPRIQTEGGSYEVVEVLSKDLLEEIRRKIRDVYKETFKAY